MSMYGLIGAVACALLALPATAAAPKKAEGHQHAPAAASEMTSNKRVAVDQLLRDLWGQHVFWTRSYLVAVVDKNEKAKGEAETQAVANATAISEAVAQFYGKAGGDQILKLLAGHWGAVKAYDDATSDGARDAAVKSLNTNAEAIATFLAKANSFLKHDAVLGLLLAHGGHHVTQTNQMKAGDYAGEAKTWEAMRQHMYVLADALTDALAQQFPKKF